MLSIWSAHNRNFIVYCQISEAARHLIDGFIKICTHNGKHFFSIVTSTIMKGKGLLFRLLLDQSSTNVLLYAGCLVEYGLALLLITIERPC